MSKDNDKLAAALKYDPKENKAPEVIAQGKKYNAQKIIDEAKEKGIPVYENSSLAKSLNQLSIGQEIPSELYEIVAQVLIFIAQMDESEGKNYE